MQNDIPEEGAYCPGGQIEQVDEDVAEVADDADPGGHSRQSVCAS